MSEPRPKRPKITRGDDDYLPGNIIEIELYNFMTFNNVKCKPGPRLNLVIGPNGSGKSSIVCAIALGLGGEPQLLGRANSLGAFVKRGQESGYIKITLRGQTVQERISITRKIDVHNKSEWIFNGRTVPKKDIVETIKKFNIQVNNLTQFLPQDRVCEFAKLTPVDLLEETEKAVGDPQLPVQHQALITKSNELKTLKRALENNKRSLDELKVLNADIERDVERIRQREELLEKVANMKKKLPWLQYDMKKAEYMEMQKQEQEALVRLKETEKTLIAFEQPINKQRLDRTVQDRKSQEISNKLEKMAEKRAQLLEQTSRLAIQVKGKYDEMTDLRRQEDSRQQKISRVKEELLSAEAELANLPPYEPPKEKLEALFAQIFEADYKAKEKTGQVKEKERLLHQHKEMLYLSSKRLKEMDDANNKRLRVLARSGADKIFDAYQWVQEHRQEFRKEVYGPVLLEVNVPHRQHANFLEGHVPYYIWKAFITQDARDRDYLVSSLKHFDVPIINHVPDGHHREPFKLTEEMGRLGISSRLDQVFDAPTAIKEVLISQFGLEYSYIGSKLTDEKANEVQRLGIMDFWTPQNHYRWTKSRYGGHISASVEAVDTARLLSGGPDAGEIEEAKAKVTELEDTISHLHRDLKELRGQVGYLTDEASKLHKQREEINNRSVIEKRKRRDMERQIAPDFQSNGKSSWMQWKRRKILMLLLRIWLIKPKF
ncbi:hypothetical protein Leryth_007142 [Lithospermum erythrorhizon]|nr:hypothetical protein Leryth_007142 [Lithospermum erythrorhizon]